MEDFIQQLGSKYDTSYDAGYVDKNGCDFIIDRAMRGAEQTFSVGQPVYDKDWNIMGWLGIGLFSSLNYGIKDVRVPVSYWKICLPTEFCEVGKKVYTYWQMKGEQLDKQQAAKWITNTYTDDITCPFCREVLKRNYFNNYCSNCGNKVESEDK